MKLPNKGKTFDNEKDQYGDLLFLLACLVLH